MSLLDEAIAVAGQWGAERASEHARCKLLLEQIIGHMEAASGVWEDFLSVVPSEGDPFTLVLWMGPERARRLHRIYLDDQETVAALTELTGVPFKDTMGIVEEVDIVRAYDELKQGETGEERAKQAIETLSQRKARLRKAIEGV